MNIVPCSNRFEFNQQPPLDQEIGGIRFNHNTIVFDRNGMLLFHLQAAFARLMRQSILVNPLQKSGPKRIGNLKRTPDHMLRYPVQSGSICVHLRSSAVQIPFIERYRNGYQA